MWITLHFLRPQFWLAFGSVTHYLRRYRATLLDTQRRQRTGLPHTFAARVLVTPSLQLRCILCLLRLPHTHLHRGSLPLYLCVHGLVLFTLLHYTTPRLRDRFCRVSYIPDGPRNATPPSTAVLLCLRLVAIPPLPYHRTAVYPRIYLRLLVLLPPAAGLPYRGLVTTVLTSILVRVSGLTPWLRL